MHESSNSSTWTDYKKPYLRQSAASDCPNAHSSLPPLSFSNQSCIFHFLLSMWHEEASCLLLHRDFQTCVGGNDLRHENTYMLRKMKAVDQYLKLLTNEKRGRLAVVAFDRSCFKLFLRKFSNTLVLAPSCDRRKTAPRTLFLSFESNNYFPRTV